MAHYSAPLRSYPEASAWLGNRARRKVAHNTYLERHGDALRLLYHRTYVATLPPDGSAELFTGGWNTSTTRERIGWVRPCYMKGGTILAETPIGGVEMGGATLTVTPDGFALDPLGRPLMPSDPPSLRYWSEEAGEWGGWVDCANAKARRRRMFRAIRAGDFSAYLAECEPEPAGKVAALALAYSARTESEAA